MKFLFGSQNYGLDVPGSDKDYIQFEYPTADALCRPIPFTREVKSSDGSMVKHIDVRALPGLFYKSNLDILQLLYSKEVYNGGEIESYFRQYEEELSTMNIPRLFNSIMGSAQNRFKSGTSKDLAHIMFGFKTLVQFEKQGFHNLRACFEHDERELYRAIRTESYDTWIKHIKQWEELALRSKESYMTHKPNESFKAQMEHDLGNMVVHHLSQKNISTRGIYHHEKVFYT